MKKKIDFRSFAQAIQSAPLVTLFDAQVRYTIKDKQILLEWTGTSSGRNFSGILTPEGLEAGKRLGINCYGVCLAHTQENGPLVYDNKITPLSFFNKLEFPL